jgi:uroporphyrinogen decarboxylase
LGFSTVDVQKVVPPDWRWPGDERLDPVVDVRFVRFPPSPEDEALRRLARPFPPDTRLGTPFQIATYDSWNYLPQEPDRRNPLARAQTLDDLRAFPFPDVSTSYRVADLAKQVSRLHARGLGVGGSLPHLGGELFETAWRLRGLESFLLDLVERPDWADLLLDRLTGMASRNAQTLARAGIDVLALADDVGMPTTMIISPDTWRRFFKPRVKQIIDSARACKPDVRVLYHSDGYFEPIIGDLIEIGVQAIHPVQPEHMDAAGIRRRFGPGLALWGTVGHQWSLQWARPEEIRREVRHRVETLGRAGLILCPAYDLDDAAVSRQNTAAFLEAAAEYGAQLP